MNNELPEFDVLVEMARSDPQRLERLRQQLTNNVIDNQPDQLKKRRLKGLAFTIDMERKRANTPMQATIKLSEMMCWKLAELNRAFIEPEETNETEAATSAKVVELRPKD